MEKNLESYMKMGIVHFMAFPELAGGKGPWVETIRQIALDPFFNAPVEAPECESFDTAKTSPYEYVSTVVYPDCAVTGTWVWLKRLGRQPIWVGEWQAKQLVAPTGMCDTGLPVAALPLWQLAQLVAAVKVE